MTKIKQTAVETHLEESYLVHLKLINRMKRFSTNHFIYSEYIAKYKYLPGKLFIQFNFTIMNWQ